MASNNRWIFTDLQLNNTPTRKCGLDSDAESTCRYQAGTLIYDIGRKLQVTQLCINTAVVYMHRFYMYHSFTITSYKSVVPACIFLAAKVEEQPRKLEHVIRMTHACLNRSPPNIDTRSEAYSSMSQEINSYETALLMTLGFDTTVEHPHMVIVRTRDKIKASTELAQSAYFLATSSLLMTAMCLRYPTAVVACVCIQVACQWSSFEIPQWVEGKPWFAYIEPSVSRESLEEMSKQFCTALDKFPNRFRMKIANNRVTTEDMGQQEKMVNFEMPAQVLAPESRSTSVPMATATLASVNGVPCRSLLPVWNSLKPRMELTSSTAETAVRPAELLLKNAKEETSSTLPVARNHPTVLRQVKTEATLDLSTKDCLEPRRLEQKKLEEKWQRDLLNMEKRDSAILSDAASTKQGKEKSILPHGTLIQDGSWIDPWESSVSKSKKEPKVEKKLEIPISESNDKSQKTKDVSDALEIDLRPEHMHGNHTLPESALLHKPSPTAPDQASAEQIHRQGNTLVSRLVLPMPPVAMTGGGRDRAHKSQRAKDHISRDVLAMEDISSHKVSVNSVNACYAGNKKIVKLPRYRTLKSCLVPSEKHQHKRERAEQYRLCDGKERLQDELPATPNAPLKLKIQIPSASSSSVVSPSKCPPDPGELKMKIKTPVVGQTRPEMESINGFKLKISLKGSSGKVESVATGDRHSSTRDDTLLQTAARINGGGTSSHGVKLVLSKDKICVGFQHGVSSHHEEQHQHHRRRRRHSKQPGTEHNGLSGKRCALHPLLGFQKLKILRLGSEVDCESNGSSNYRNSVICSGSYSQHPGYSTSVQETAFSHSMLSKPCQMLPVAGLVQPPLPPPLPGESSPLPSPLPPC